MLTDGAGELIFLPVVYSHLTPGRPPTVLVLAATFSLFLIVLIPSTQEMH